MYKIESFINSLGHDVNVYIDEYPESPREWDNMWQWVSNQSWPNYGGRCERPLRTNKIKDYENQN